MLRPPLSPFKSLSKRLFARSLLVAGALGACLWAAPAAAQTPPPPYLKWTARQMYGAANVNANDEGADIVYWAQKDQFGQVINQWIYVTGWVTEMNANNTVKGTRFATFKYDATYNGPLPPTPSATAYFPPTGISQGDTYKAVAMALWISGDQTNAEIYITGQGPHTPGTANNQDYVTIKYDKALGQPWGLGVAGARFYDGPVSGNDIPADIAIDAGDSVVVVTGTSPGNGTGQDIATVARLAGNGDPAGDPITLDYWPDINGWGAGVRRYDHIPVSGDDRGVKLGPVTVDFNLQTPINLAAIVLGTSYGGTTLEDFTTHMWTTGYSTPYWEKRFDLGLNDTATGFSYQGTTIYCAGYSEIPPDQGGGDVNTPPADIDYSVVSYNTGGNIPPPQRWYGTWNYAGAPDYCYDIATQTVGSDIHVWLTGQATTGARKDVGTVHYLDNSLGVTRDFTTGFNVGGLTTFNYGKAIALQDVFTPALPYITGATGYTNNDWMLALKYKDTPTPYTLNWFRTYSVDGFDEGRALVVRQVDGGATNFSVYITGTSSASGSGRDFCTWRYRE